MQDSQGVVFELPKLYPKQIEFCEAQGKMILYGGARGGGKSFVARVKMVLLALYYPGIQILLMRRTFPELRSNHINPLIKMLKSQNPDKTQRIAEWRESQKAFLFKNGSRLLMGYCDTPVEVNQFQGQAYDVIFLEEATLFEEEIFTALTTSNRLSGEIKNYDGTFQPRMYFTANPGGKLWKQVLFMRLKTILMKKFMLVKQAVLDNVGTTIKQMSNVLIEKASYTMQ